MAQSTHRIIAVRCGGPRKGRVQHRIVGPCQACGQPTTDLVDGPRQRARQLIANGLVRCRACLETGTRISIRRPHRQHESA